MTANLKVSAKFCADNPITVSRNQVGHVNALSHCTYNGKSLLHVGNPSHQPSPDRVSTADCTGGSLRLGGNHTSCSLHLITRVQGASWLVHPVKIISKIQLPLDQQAWRGPRVPRGFSPFDPTPPACGLVLGRALFCSALPITLVRRGFYAVQVLGRARHRVGWLRSPRSRSILWPG